MKNANILYWGESHLVFLSSCRPSSPPTLQNNDEMKKVAFFISKTTEPRRTITNRLESQWKKFTHSLRARTAYKDCHPPLWVLPNRYHTLPCCNCLHNICREAWRWKGEGRGGAWQKIRKTQQHKTTLTWSCITTNLNMTITTIMSLRGRTTSQVVAWSP